MPALPWVCCKPEGSRSWFRLTFFFTLILARADCNLERCFNIMVFQAPPHFTPWPMSRSYTSTCCTHNDTSVMHWSTQACMCYKWRLKLSCSLWLNGSGVLFLSEAWCCWWSPAELMSISVFHTQVQRVAWYSDEKTKKKGFRMHHNNCYYNFKTIIVCIKSKQT